MGTLEDPIQAVPQYETAAYGTSRQESLSF